jgi:hypothetical protein
MAVVKNLRIDVRLDLTPAKVRKLIALASERYTVPAVLSDLDRRQLARRGAVIAVEQLTRGSKREN